MLYKRNADGTYYNATTGEIVSSEYVDGLLALQEAVQEETSASMDLRNIETEYAEILQLYFDAQERKKEAAKAIEEAKERIRAAEQKDEQFVILANVKKPVFASDAELVDYLVEHQHWTFLKPDKTRMKKELAGQLPHEIYHEVPEVQQRVKADYSILSVKVDVN